MEAPSFMESPLVVWIQTFSAELVTYQDLCDGIFLAEVMQQIDPKANLDGIAVRVDDKKDRLQNWDMLMMTIYSFYKEVLQQYVVLQPPDVNVICIHPLSEASHVELERVLLLVLGCAVQSENKVALVENIKQLDTDIQCAIVNCIQTITDCSRSVMPTTLLPSDVDERTLQMYNHTCLLLAQRDSYVQTIKALHSKLDDELRDIDDVLMTPASAVDKSLISSEHVSDLSPSSKRYHSNIELAQCKAKLRRLRHDMEEKCDAVEELQEELESLKQTEQRTRLENRELLEEARAAKFYRDELDIVREKVSRVDKYELEITRLKERLNEFEFYRARVDELRGDNSALLDANQQLSDQLTSCHSRIAAVVQLESDLLAYKQQLTVFAKERDQDKERIVDLIRQNSQLEFDRKLFLGENYSADDQLQRASSHADSGNSGVISTLMDQLSEAANSQILRLQLDNQSLKRQLEEMKENALLENTGKLLELERENDRLSNKLSKLLDDICEKEKSNVELERNLVDLNRSHKHLEETVELVKETGERKLREFEREKQLLLQNVETMRERIEKTGDMRIKDLETENKRLSENSETYVTQIAEAEYKIDQMEKSCEKSTELIDELEQLKKMNESYRREVDEQQKTISTLRVSCEKIQEVEEGTVKLQIENNRLLKTVELLEQNASGKEEIVKENVNLKREIQQLKPSVELFKESSTQLAEVLHEKQRLKNEIFVLQGEKSTREVANEQLVVKLADKEEQHCRLEKKFASVSENFEELKQELEQSKTENSKKIKALVDEQKHLERKLESLDSFSKELEVENRRLLKEKQATEKENRKFKQAVDAKESEFDELRTKMFEMENANKMLNKTTERCKELESCIQELEQENLELMQKMKMDSKTLAALRQDLVNEKVKGQQLTDEVSRLSRQTELDWSQSTGVERARTESKYRQREMKIEENFEKQVSNYEEQMGFLQKSLEEMRSENKKLVAELESMKNLGSSPRDRTLYVTQRYSHVQHSSRAQPASAASNFEDQGDIRQLRNQLNAAESQISKLQEEARSLKEANSALHSRINYNDDWQTQYMAVQSKFSEFQLQYNELQSKLAAVQVENATLSSQNSSLGARNSELQSKVSQLESRHHSDRQKMDDMSSILENVEQDHDALQQLHERLSREHETMLTEHSSLKANHKDVKARLRLLSEQNSVLHREMETVAELRAALERDKANETQSYSTLQTSYIQVREENLNLVNTNDKLNADIRELQSNLRATKSRLHTMKSTKDDLDGHLQDREGQIRAMDMELSRLLSRNTALSESNSKLEEDNRTLMGSLQAVMSQNQELLTQLLNAKDQRVEEHKYYSEKLSEVQYRKEKLDEKIQQSKRDDENSRNKTSNFASNLVKKLTIRLSKEKDKGKTIQSYYESSLTTDSLSLESSSSSTQKSSETLPTEGELFPSKTLDWPLNRGRRRNVHEVRRAPSFAGSSSGGDSFPTPQKLRTSTSTGSGFRDEVVFNDNEDEDGNDDESITLDQFLKECNKSPKSRRKLLVEKRIVLDDEPSTTDLMSDRTLANLPPRSAIISDDPNPASPLKHYKSEANVSRPRSSSRILESLQSACSSPSNHEQTSTRSKSRRMTSKRLVTSVSVSDNLSDYQSFSNTPLKQTQANGQPGRGNGAAHQRWEQQPDAGNRGQQAPSSSSNGRDSGNPIIDRPAAYGTRVVELPVDVAGHHRVSRPKSVPPKFGNQQIYDVELGGDDVRSQYEPSNVRQLVQSYQTSYHPSSTASSVTVSTNAGGGTTTYQRPVQGQAPRGPSQPRVSQQNSSTGNRSGSQRFQSSQQPASGDVYRTDINVCIVRPANGRTLPQPPVNNGNGSTGRTTPGLGKNVVQAEKKSKAVYEYGCL